MSQQHASPVERFPGVVTLPDGLTFPQVIALEQAIGDSQGKTGAASEFALLPGLLACVERVEIAGVGNTAETWPATPRREAAALVAWLTGLIMRLYAGELEIPNA